MCRVGASIAPPMGWEVTGLAASVGVPSMTHSALYLPTHMASSREGPRRRTSAQRIAPTTGHGTNQRANQKCDAGDASFSCRLQLLSEFISQGVHVPVDPHMYMYMYWYPYMS